MSRDIVHLEVTNWKGISLGAQHYYGQLKAYIQDDEAKFVELQHPLNKDEAENLRKAHDWKYYKEGSVSSCFETKESVIEFAKLVWREHYPDAKILVLGHWVYYEGKLVLDADDKSIIGMEILT